MTAARATTRRRALGRRAANDSIELDTVYPRRVCGPGSWWWVFELVRSDGDWCVLARREGASLASRWRIVDPSGIELDCDRVARGLGSPRVRRDVPPWVARVFERVRVVGDRLGIPVVALNDNATREAV